MLLPKSSTRRGLMSRGMSGTSMILSFVTGCSHKEQLWYSQNQWKSCVFPLFTSRRKSPLLSKVAVVGAESAAAPLAVDNPCPDGLDCRVVLIKVLKAEKDRSMLQGKKKVVWGQNKMLWVDFFSHFFYQFSFLWVCRGSHKTRSPRADVAENGARIGRMINQGVVVGKSESRGETKLRS